MNYTTFLILISTLLSVALNKGQSITTLGLKYAPTLIYHGMADDKVLFTNVTKLIITLHAGKEVKVHLNKTIMDFFDRQLKKYL